MLLSSPSSESFISEILSLSIFLKPSEEPSGSSSQSLFSSVLFLRGLADPGGFEIMLIDLSSSSSSYSSIISSSLSTQMKLRRLAPPLTFKFRFTFMSSCNYFSDRRGNAAISRSLNGFTINSSSSRNSVLVSNPLPLLSSFWKRLQSWQSSSSSTNHTILRYRGWS